MPKNTLILVAFLAIAAIAVAGVNLVKNPGKNTRAPIANPTQTIQLTTYTSASCGITFNYPNSYTKLETPDNSAVLTGPSNPPDTIVLICQKDIPRVPLPDDKIEPMQIGTIAAKLYHDKSTKDGSPIDKLIFTNPKTGVDVYVAGLGDVFHQVITSLRIN